MQNPFQPNLRKLWILLCTTALLTYTIMPVEHETLFYDDASSAWLEALMFLLSFPLGDAVLMLFYSESHGLTGRLATWALAMGVGYAQWFHLFPALLRDRPAPAPITLNLSAAPGVAYAPGMAAGGAATPARALPHARPTHSTDGPPTAPFDERGLTPVERVFREKE